MHFAIYFLVFFFVPAFAAPTLKSDATQAPAPPLVPTTPLSELDNKSKLKSVPTGPSFYPSIWSPEDGELATSTPRSPPPQISVVPPSRSPSQSPTGDHHSPQPAPADHGKLGPSSHNTIYETSSQTPSSIPGNTAVTAPQKNVPQVTSHQVQFASASGGQPEQSGSRLLRILGLPPKGPPEIPTPSHISHSPSPPPQISVVPPSRSPSQSPTGDHHSPQPAPTDHRKLGPSSHNIIYETSSQTPSSIPGNTAVTAPQKNVPQVTSPSHQAQFASAPSHISHIPKSTTAVAKPALAPKQGGSITPPRRRPLSGGVSLGPPPASPGHSPTSGPHRELPSAPNPPSSHQGAHQHQPGSQVSKYEPPTHPPSPHSGPAGSNQGAPQHSQS